MKHPKSRRDLILEIRALRGVNANLNRLLAASLQRQRTLSATVREVVPLAFNKRLALFTWMKN